MYTRSNGRKTASSSDHSNRSYSPELIERSDDGGSSTESNSTKQQGCCAHGSGNCNLYKANCSSSHSATEIEVPKSELFAENQNIDYIIELGSSNGAVLLWKTLKDIRLTAEQVYLGVMTMSQAEEQMGSRPFALYHLLLPRQEIRVRVDCQLHLITKERETMFSHYPIEHRNEQDRDVYRRLGRSKKETFSSLEQLVQYLQKAEKGMGSYGVVPPQDDVVNSIYKT